MPRPHTWLPQLVLLTVILRQQVLLTVHRPLKAHRLPRLRLPQPQPLRKPEAEPKLPLLLPLLLSNRIRSILIDIAQPLRSTT